MRVWGITDIGLIRKDNQDNFGIVEKTESGHTLCVVCDGMGGEAGGRLASSTAVDVWIAEMRRLLRPEMTPEQIREVTGYAVSMANAAIREKAQADESCRNMGTTLVSAVAGGGTVVVGNVGDSRAYLVTNDDITRITKDHSLVESMVDRGDITAEEARRHPKRNYITRALGPDPSVVCDGYTVPLRPGDYLLLCTDGLVGTVADQEMLFEIIHGEGSETCLRRLVEIARSHGAPDNVTAVLMKQE